MKITKQILILFYIVGIRLNSSAQDSATNIEYPAYSFVNTGQSSLNGGEMYGTEINQNQSDQTFFQAGNSENEPKIKSTEQTFSQRYDRYLYMGFRYDRVAIDDNAFNNWAEATYQKTYHPNVDIGFQWGYKCHDLQYGIINIYGAWPNNIKSSDLETVMFSSSLGRTFNLRNSILTVAVEPGYFHAGTSDLDPSKNSWYAKNPCDTTHVLRYNAFYLGLSITDMLCYNHGPFHTSLEFKAGCFPFGGWRYGYVTNTNTPVNSNTGGVTVSDASDFTGAVKAPEIPNFQTYVSLGVLFSIVTEAPREHYIRHTKPL